MPTRPPTGPSTAAMLDPWHPGQLLCPWILSTKLWKVLKYLGAEVIMVERAGTASIATRDWPYPSPCVLLSQSPTGSVPQCPPRGASLNSKDRVQLHRGQALPTSWLQIHRNSLVPWHLSASGDQECLHVRSRFHSQRTESVRVLVLCVGGEDGKETGALRGPHQRTSREGIRASAWITEKEVLLPCDGVHTSWHTRLTYPAPALKDLHMKVPAISRPHSHPACQTHSAP